MGKEKKEKKMFQAGNGDVVCFHDIPKRLLKFYEQNKHFCSQYHMIIGTDSQNRSKTKIVSVICITCQGHGGIFFYEITNQPLIFDVRRKLQVETSLSLQLATILVEMLENNSCYDELYLNCPISIYVDAGNSPKGKTADLIPEIMGWIQACGYDAYVKPESFVASSIADKLSK